MAGIDLRAFRRTFHSELQWYRTEVQEGTVDTAFIDTQLTRINIEMDILDPIMSNLFELQPEKLHAWKRSNRVERDPHRAQKDSGENSTTPEVVPG